MVANQAEIPEGYEIHHIDGNPSNNSIYNLELLLKEEHNKLHVEYIKKNIEYLKDINNKKSNSHKGKSSGMKGKNHSEKTRNKMSESHKGKSSGMKGKYNNPNTSKKVAKISLNDEFIKEYNSISEAAREGFNPAHISACCLGKLKQHKGFKWKHMQKT